MRGTRNPKIIDNPVFILAVWDGRWALWQTGAGLIGGDGGNGCLDVIGVPGCSSKQDKGKMKAVGGKAKEGVKK